MTLVLLLSAVTYAMTVALYGRHAESWREGHNARDLRVEANMLRQVWYCYRFPHIAFLPAPLHTTQTFQTHHTTAPDGPLTTEQ